MSLDTKIIGEMKGKVNRWKAGAEGSERQKLSRRDAQDPKKKNSLMILRVSAPLCTLSHFDSGIAKADPKDLHREWLYPFQLRIQFSGRQAVP